MKILFYDPATPSPYTQDTLKTSALRGTETSIIRIAHALSREHQISIAEHCRAQHETQSIDGVEYITCDAAHSLNPDIVILLRQANYLELITTHFPKARHFFWMHNLPMRHLYTKRELIIKHGIEIIAVSDYHRLIIENRLKTVWYKNFFNKENKPPITIHTIYNPVEDDLFKDGTEWNSEQMIVTSSPYKGLAQILKHFEKLRYYFPNYQLIIASPIKHDQKLPPNVRYLNPLPQKQLIQYIRESFCVFYPQSERVETFGFIYAEANAVGTPVLAHNFGAAREVLSDSSQLINGNKINNIVRTIAAWQEMRPQVTLKPIFRLSQVIEKWKRLFTVGNRS